MFNVVIKIRGALAIPEKEHKKLVIDSLVRIGLYWHRYFRPKHFTEAGAREYRYKRRAVNYNKQKLRIVRHQDPLVFSGISKQLSRVYRVQRTKESAKIVMSGVRAFNRKNPRSKIDMVDEFRRVSSSERDKLAKLAQENLELRYKRKIESKKIQVG